VYRKIAMTSIVILVPLNRVAPGWRNDAGIKQLINQRSKGNGNVSGAS
jgi:hypothetical protein